MVAQARRRAKHTRDAYYLHILDLDARPGSWGRGRSYHQWRSILRQKLLCTVCSPQSGTTESRDLACPVSCGQTTTFSNLLVPWSKSVTQYSMDLQARPLLGPLFPGKKDYSWPLPLLDSCRRHFLKLWNQSKNDTSPQE